MKINTTGRINKGLKKKVHFIKEPFGLPFELSKKDVFLNPNIREEGTPLKPVKNVLFVGRRWFDKVNGNTYHTTELYVNGKFVAKSERTYGYGNHYEQTGLEMLQNAGYFPKTGASTPSGANADDMYFYSFKRKHPDAVISTVSDVARRSDL